MIIYLKQIRMSYSYSGLLDHSDPSTSVLSNSPIKATSPAFRMDRVLPKPNVLFKKMSGLNELNNSQNGIYDSFNTIHNYDAFASFETYTCMLLPVFIPTTCL